MEMLLQELIEMVKGATPALWEAAMRRVTAMAIADSLIAIILVLMVVLMYKKLAKYSKDQSELERWEKNDDLPIIWAGYWASAAVSMIVIILEFYSVVMYLASPEIAAIQVLVGLVK